MLGIAGLQILAGLSFDSAIGFRVFRACLVLWFIFQRLKIRTIAWVEHDHKFGGFICLVGCNVFWVVIFDVPILACGDKVR